jgi:hypothetical protein
MTYETELQVAIERTKAWGLESPTFTPSPRRFLSDAVTERVMRTASSIAGHLSPQQIAAQCFAVSTFLLGPLQDALGVPLLYTIGYVQLKDGPVFYSAVDELKTLLDHPMNVFQKLKLHAWLTLPSHEILDLTWGTTYGLAQDVPKMVGNAVFRHPDDLVGGQEYHPQLVGLNYMRRIGAMVEF